MKQISFVVPVYNVEKYISECIESLLQQGKETGDIEIILVDDGSRDNSLEICKRYEAKYTNVRVYHQENSGANVARNLGLEKASGEWVCFVDGDDWVALDMYSSLEAELQKEWDFIIFSYNKSYPSEIKPVTSNMDYMEIYKNDFREMQLATLNRLRKGKYSADVLDVVSIWNKVYRREFLKKNQLCFVPELPKLQDLTFNLNVYDCAEKSVYINKKLYNYRINADSVTHRYQSDIVAKFSLINNYIENFVNRKADAEYRQMFYERIATHFRTIVVLYLCNSKNEKGYFERRREFLELLKQEPYYTAMKKADLTHFSFKERVLSTAIKHHFFSLCEILNWLEGLMRA